VTKLILKILKYFLITITTTFGLLIILLSSVWVVGPRLFALDNFKNILFTSSEIDSPKSQIYMAYFFPSTSEITVTPLKSSQVSVLGGYGDYELERVYPLLTMERKKNDFNLAALSWGTETLVDNIADIKPNALISNKKQLQQQLWTTALSHIANPQESIELLKAFFFTRSVPTEQITFEDNYASVDELNILDNVVLYEGCSVAVVNTTEKTGLALKVSDILEKNGAIVIRVTDQNSPYQLSTFSFDSEHGSCQSLSQRLQVLFPSKVTKQVHHQLQQEYRADLIIFIGKDLANLI
jgi:hypothetical protein